jgi:hypothetical protein
MVGNIGQAVNTGLGNFDVDRLLVNPATLAFSTRGLMAAVCSLINKSRLRSSLKVSAIRVTGKMSVTGVQASCVRF